MTHSTQDAAALMAGKAPRGLTLQRGDQSTQEKGKRCSSIGPRTAGPGRALEGVSGCPRGACPRCFETPRAVGLNRPGPLPPRVDAGRSRKEFHATPSIAAGVSYTREAFGLQGRCASLGAGCAAASAPWGDRSGDLGPAHSPPTTPCKLGERVSFSFARLHHLLMSCGVVVTRRRDICHLLALRGLFLFFN